MASSLGSWLGQLEEDGWSLQHEEMEELVQELEKLPTNLAALRRVLLDADLKKVGKPCLPDDINRADSKRLAGPHVLQVVSAQDCAQPSKFADADRKGRILRIKMTDGKGSCVGVEYSALPAVKTEQLVPGTKVRLRGAAVRVGVVLLGPNCFEVLGGRVEALAEGWEMQQRFGGTAERPLDEAVAERPPPFRHFDAEDAALAGRRPTQATAVLPAAVAAAEAAAVRGGGAGRGGRGGGRGGRGGPSAQQQQQQQHGREPPGIAQQGRRGFQPYQPPAARAAEPPAQRAQQQQEQPTRPGSRQQEQRGGQPPQQQQHQQQPQGGRQQEAGAGPTAPTAAQGAHAPAVQTSDAAKQRLLEKLAASDMQGGRGRGRGFRRGRRGRYDEDEDDGSMTLEEWEAQQVLQRAGRSPGAAGAAGAAGGGLGAGSTAGASGAGGIVFAGVGDAVAGSSSNHSSSRGGGGGGGGAAKSQLEQDEELARELQRQLDMEAWAYAPPGTGQQAQQRGGASDLAASLFSYQREEPTAGGYRGRGRGRGRGR